VHARSPALPRCRLARVGARVAAFGPAVLVVRLLPRVASETCSGCAAESRGCGC
jgi:hypothetical protein